MARKPAYRCWYNHSRGRAVCENTLVVDKHRDDTRAASDHPRRTGSRGRGRGPRPGSRELEQPAAVARRRLDGLKSELVRMEVELARYADAIADAGPLDNDPTGDQGPRATPRRDPHGAQDAGPPRHPASDAAKIRATLDEYLQNWRRWRARAWPKRAASYARSSSVDSCSADPRPPRTAAGEGPRNGRRWSTSSRARRHSPGLSRV